MNCSRFRFLIQQWFDAPLSAQDERMLVSHIESCDSCARFQHQLDQVVQGTPDVALPDDCLPSNLEALAKRIMVEIPQEKPSIFSFFRNMFGGIGGGGGKKSAPAQAQKGGKAPVQAKGKTGKGKQAAVAGDMPAPDDSLSGASQFPHVRRRDDPKPVKKAGAAPVVDEELLATSTRLKNLQQKLQPIQDEAQAQSQGLSLGTKFGMNVPMRDSASSEDAPLTLAESIRRKMVEDKAVGENQQITSGSQNFSQGAPQSSPGFGQFPAAGTPGGFSADGAQFAPPPGFGSTFGQPPQPSGFGQGQPAPGPGSGQAAAPPPANFSQSGGNNPMVGQWGDSSTSQAPTPAPAQAGQPGWGDPPRPGVGGDNDWKPQPPQTDWSAGRAPVPQPGNWSPPQGAPAPAGQGDNQWGGAGGNGSWGETTKQQAPAGFAPGQPGQTPPQQSWAQPQPAGWGDAAQSQSQAGAFPDPSQSQAQQPVQGSAPAGWGQPAPTNWADNQSASGFDLQGQAAAQSSNQPQGWAQQGSAQAQAQQQPQGWGQAQQNSWGAQSAPDSQWGAQQAAPAQAASDGWATAVGAGNNGWNQPPSAPNAGWGQPGASPPMPGAAAPQPGWSTGQPQAQPAGSPQAQGVNPFLTSTPAPAAPVPQGQNQEFEAWSEEGEQIQTGMWQAFNMDQPEIGQPKPGEAQVQRPGGLPIANKPSAEAGRFEMPIQNRGEGANLAAAAAGKGDPSMFDVPIQERMKMQQQAAQADAPKDSGRWDMPVQRPGQQEVPAFAAPAQGAAPSAAGAGPNKNSIMDRLNKVLGDDLAAMAAANPNPVQPWGTAPGAATAPAPQAPYAAPAASSGPMAAPPAPPAVPSVPPMQAMPAPQAPQAPAAAQAAAASGLFSLNDQQIDKVFRENLGVSDPARPVGGQAVPPPAVPPPAVPPVPPQSQAPSFGGPKITAVPPRAAQSEPVQAPGQVDSSGLLKNIDDRAMDQIFANNLGVKDVGSQAVNQGAPMQSAPVAAPLPPLQPQPQAPPSPYAIPAQPQPQQPAYPPAQGQAQVQAPRPSGLLNVDDDAMDRIFADLGVKEKGGAGPKINVREAVNQIRNIADVPAPPKVEGISRLGREEVVSDPTPGKINAIGKFLLDQQDLAKIGRLTEEDLSDTKVRVLTHEASDEINRLLAHIAVQPGVVGSVIVGHDGILIANSLPREQDPETVGILSLGIYFNTTNTTKKMAHNHLHQLVCRTHMGYLVIADFGGGILVTVSNELAIETLIPLMRSITQLVAQA